MRAESKLRAKEAFVTNIQTSVRAEMCQILHRMQSGRCLAGNREGSEEEEDWSVRVLVGRSSCSGDAVVVEAAA